MNCRAIIELTGSLAQTNLLLMLAPTVAPSLSIRFHSKMHIASRVFGIITMCSQLRSFQWGSNIPGRGGGCVEKVEDVLLGDNIMER